jgi:hypothetical protein
MTPAFRIIMKVMNGKVMETKLLMTCSFSRSIRKTGGLLVKDVSFRTA